MWRSTGACAGRTSPRSRQRPTRPPPNATSRRAPAATPDTLTSRDPKDEDDMPKVRFEPDGIEIEVPIGTSILEASQKAHAQVGSACGGVCACSTCHVYGKRGLEVLEPASDREEDI